MSITSGQIVWIGARPARDQAMVSVTEAQFALGRGLVGDRYGKKPTRSGMREVSLIAAEDLAELARRLGISDVVSLYPKARRNLVLQGVDLQTLVRTTFALGTCQFEGTGSCDPCMRMNLAFGAGGFQAMQGLGGITARVLRPGMVRIGDGLNVEAAAKGP